MRIKARKDPDAGKESRQKEKGVAEDEVVSQHRRLSGHELARIWEIMQDRGAWHAAVHEAANFQTRLSDWTTTTTT